jgi:hypothetical protein
VGVRGIAPDLTRLLGLDPDWSEGKLHKARLQRADRRFQGGPPALRVLMLQHPLSAPEGFRRAVVDPLPELLELMGRCRVDLVLCGHFHRSHLALIGPGPAWQAVVSQAATVCSTRLQGEPPGFHEVRADADRIEIVRSCFLSGRFVEESVHSFSRGACGWAASSAGAADPAPR